MTRERSTTALALFWITTWACGAYGATMNFPEPTRGQLAEMGLALLKDPNVCDVDRAVRLKYFEAAGVKDPCIQPKSAR